MKDEPELKGRFTNRLVQRSDVTPPPASLSECNRILKDIERWAAYFADFAYGSPKQVLAALDLIRSRLDFLERRYDELSEEEQQCDSWNGPEKS